MLHKIISLQVCEPADQMFLFELYCRIREPEFAPLFLPPAQKMQIFRMQYDAQAGAYAAQYPGSSYKLILVNGERVGRVWIARLPDELRLVDIGLMPEARNRGIGTRILKDVQEEARRERKPVRLSVSSFNEGSLRFHQRLGFRIHEENHVDRQLEWMPYQD